MSSRKGSAKKAGQKHQNHSAFRNNLHDTSKQTKMINSLEVTGCCQRCKEIIEWKIKYKKYKPLTVPKKCVRCSQKTVLHAYYIMCMPCAKKENSCAKCAEKKDVVLRPRLSAAEEASQQNQLQQELKALTERQRRSFFRLQESGKLSSDDRKSAAGAAATSADGDSENESSDELEQDGICQEFDEQCITERGDAECETGLPGGGSSGCCCEERESEMEEHPQGRPDNEGAACGHSSVEVTHVAQESTTGLGSVAQSKWDCQDSSN